jgi:hypothetical protein
MDSIGDRPGAPGQGCNFRTQWKGDNGESLGSVLRYRRSTRKALERIYGPGNYDYVGVDTEAKFGAELYMDVRDCDYQRSYPTKCYIFFDNRVGKPSVHGVLPRKDAWSPSAGARGLNSGKVLGDHCVLRAPATGLLKTREIIQPLSRYIHTCS